MKPENMRVIQEFERLGLGEGHLENIRILGCSLEDLQAQFKIARKELEKKLRVGMDRLWSPAKAINELIADGFFKDPNRRTLEDV